MASPIMARYDLCGLVGSAADITDVVTSSPDDVKGSCAVDTLVPWGMVIACDTDTGVVLTSGNGAPEYKQGSFSSNSTGWNSKQASGPRVTLRTELEGAWFGVTVGVAATPGGDAVDVCTTIDDGWRCCCNSLSCPWFAHVTCSRVSMNTIQVVQTHWQWRQVRSHLGVRTGQILGYIRWNFLIRT